MDISIETRTEQIAVVQLKGKLDIFSTSEVKQQLAQVVANGTPHLVVDLAHVDFIDSSGLTALISGLKTARLVEGDLCVARPSTEVQTILEFTRLDRVMRLFPTVEDAVAAYTAT